MLIGEDILEWLDVILVRFCVIVICCLKYVFKDVDGVVQVFVLVYIIESGLLIEVLLV